ncbi:hypothetical protein RHMOL_Rhmol10G0269800 [Rhododendron molle]|uniref:Uncharacterized protein n=1 Tax=Rhododendron molle TaxID=49168 RepID=A0ACC0M7W0_RHOML|nr:hypothetical protein RHMOL_Rhmol10G0269800 [Rhododendron molle]
MDVFFEPTRGIPFALEVGYFDTISEIKQRIHKKHKIPTSKQTLILNGEPLADDLSIYQSDILDRTLLQLLVEPETPRKIQILAKMPTSKHGLNVEMNSNDTVRRLKELLINQMDGTVPINRLVLKFNGHELKEDGGWVLHDYDISDGSEIEMGIRPSPATSSSTGSGNPSGGSRRKMRVMVRSKCGSMKVPVEVRAGDNVGVLRNEVMKLVESGGFLVPADGFFFIYKQNVMDEDRSFRWHNVGPGDTIEVFNGSVSGGL